MRGKILTPTLEEERGRKGDDVHGSANSVMQHHEEEEELQQERKEYEQPPSAGINDMFLLLLELSMEREREKSPASGAGGSLECWQCLRETGLGPFLFLCAHRVMYTKEISHFVVLRPTDMSLPDLLESLIPHFGLTIGKSLALHVRCIQAIPLQAGSMLGEVVEGPTLFMRKGKVLRTSSTISHGDTSDMEEEERRRKGINYMEKITCENEAFLCSLLKQTSVWSMALLERCGVITRHGDFIFQEGSSDNNWNCIALAVKAMRYLQETTHSQVNSDEEETVVVVDITGIIVKWACLMYTTLKMYPGQETDKRDIASMTHTPLPATTPVRRKGRKRKSPHKKGGMAIAEEYTVMSQQRITKSDPPHSLSLVSSTSISKYRSSASASHSNSCAVIEMEEEEEEDEDEGNGEKSWLYAPPTPTTTPEVIVTNNMKAKEKCCLPLMSLCSEVIEDGFQLHQKHLQRRRKRHNNDSNPLGACIHDREERSGSINSHHSTSNSGTTCEGVEGVNPGDCSSSSTSSSGSSSSSGSGIKEEKSNIMRSGCNYLSSLIHSLMSKCYNTSPNNQFTRQLSMIAQRDFFPTQRMLEEWDVLHRHFGETLIVCFYDLDPQQHQQQQHTSSFVNENTLPPSGSFSAGLFNTTGHLCHLFVTQTDIILMSVFEDNYSFPAWPVINNKNNADDDPMRGKKSTAATDGGGEGEKEEEEGASDVPHCMKRMLVIPRVSLMEIRLMDNSATAGDGGGGGSGGGGAKLMRLQTRSCRRIWLSFQKKQALDKVHEELNSGLRSSFSRNRFLASAQRTWRMNALTLLAGDILPSPYTPFYQQLLQNLLVVFAEVESRRQHCRQTDESSSIVSTEQTLEKADVGTCIQEKKILPHFWWLYSPAEEFKRQRIPEQHWRLSNVNNRYQHFHSYPAEFVVPRSLKDDMLIKSSELHARGRVEALSYYYSHMGTGIVRAAQPAAVKFCSSSAKEDTTMAYKRASGMQITVLDLRSRENAYANIFAGGGFRILEKGKYCSLANIHGVRGSYETLCEAVLDRNPSFSSVMKSSSSMIASRMDTHAAAPLCNNDFSSLESLEKSMSVWIQHISSILHTARCAARLVAGVSEAEELPPAAASTLSGAHVNSVNSTGNALTKKCNMNVSGMNDRVIPGSTPLYVWTRAFHPMLLGRNGDNTSSGLLRETQKNMPPLPPPRSPPSYTQARNRRNASLIFVNCSDGWDRTAQVCALTQILLDPYFRTVEGFITLLEKEFVSFGHPCLLRSTTLSSHNECGTQTTNIVDGGAGMKPDVCLKSSTTTTEQSSPIILQFIDCVHQLLHLYPPCFEFNESFLLLIVDLLHSGILGTFAVDCEADIYRMGVEHQTVSLSQFFTVLFSTTIPVDRSNHSPDDHDNDDKDNKDDDDGCKSTLCGPRSPLSPPSSPSSLLSHFYHTFGGGETLGNIAWDTSEKCSPRRIPLSRDAMLHSGLLNPHFSLSDNNRLFGPLIDVVHPSQIKFWERFFLRHQFFWERAEKIKQFAEQSTSTFFASVVESLTAESMNMMPRKTTTKRRITTTATTAAAAVNTTTLFPCCSSQNLLETHAVIQPTNNNGRPHTAPTVSIEINDGSEDLPCRKPASVPVTIVPSLCMLQRENTNDGMYTPPARSLSHQSIVTLGSCTPTTKRTRKYEVEEEYENGDEKAHDGAHDMAKEGVEEHYQKQWPISLLPRNVTNTVAMMGNAVSVGSPRDITGQMNGTRRVFPKSVSTELVGAPLRNYSTLLDNLDQAFE